MLAEGEVDEEESGEVAAVPVVVVVAPTCYRWISTLKSSPDAPPGAKMFLSFPVPTSLLPAVHQPALEGDGNVMMMVPEQQQQQQQSKPRAPSIHDVDGCTATGKYRCS
jgi:hypothetical protein